MPDYQALYFQLMNAVTDAIHTLDSAACALRQAQCRAEEDCLSAPEPDLVCLRQDQPAPEER